MMPDDPKRRPWHRVCQRLAASRPGAWLFKRTLHHLDRPLLWLSGGRFSIPEVLAGLTVIRLTTIGARTGRERTVPVVGLREGERWFVVASNWGDERHPAWYHNLRANPRVRVTYRDDTREYVAEVADEEARERYWARATEAYVGFEPYQARAGDREIPIVVLTPADEAEEGAGTEPRSAERVEPAANG